MVHRYSPVSPQPPPVRRPVCTRRVTCNLNVFDLGVIAKAIERQQAGSCAREAGRNVRILAEFGPYRLQKALTKSLRTSCFRNGFWLHLLRRLNPGERLPDDARYHVIDVPVHEIE